jgi:hypothetical protein
MGPAKAGPIFYLKIANLMFLTAYNLPHYLMSRGLVSTESVVAGDFALAETGRRNRNFKIMRRSHPGLFVKQIKTAEAQAISTIDREAAFYRVVHSDPKYAAIRNLIPRFVDFDPTRHALTLSLTENAESMAEHHARGSIYPEATARQIGTALGLVHWYGPRMLADPATRSLFPCQIPWPLTLDQTGYSFLDGFGAVGAELSKAIQQRPTLQPKLSALRPYWQYDSLIHGDMKWDNCLVSRRTGDELEVSIVDWELADIGDGAWDVATIFKEYLVATIVRAGAQPPSPPGPTIETLRPSMRAFWDAYATARRIPAEHRQGFLSRAICFTAGRMVIAALEYVVDAAYFNAWGPTMLETSVYLLDAPQLAAAQMLGVPVG